MTSKKKKNIPLISTPTVGYIDVSEQRTVWEETCKDFNGTFKISHTKSNDIEIHRISIPYKKHNIKATVSDTRPLKFELEFKSLIDFNFTISWEGFIERLLKKLGSKEMETGNKDFDKKYLLKTNEPILLKKILTADIQKSIVENNIYSFTYETNFEKQSSNLLSVISRKPYNKEGIKEIIFLFQALIDSMQSAKIILQPTY